MCFHRGEQMTSLQIHQMDQSEDWNKLQQRGGDENFQKHHHHFLKRILQFVFSVSVFSFLLWYSFGCSILPHDESINAFFSTFLFSIFSHILERKYMFLLCNAILAFLAKTSLSLSDNTDIDYRSLQSANAMPISIEVPSLMADEEQEKKQDHCEEEEQVAEADDDEEQEDGDRNIIEASTAKEEEEEEEEEEVGTTGDSTEVMVGMQDGEAADDPTVAETEELSNADELNRKFEEFIRKMKEEIRIEAQRQLIAV